MVRDDVKDAFTSFRPRERPTTGLRRAGVGLVLGPGPVGTTFVLIQRTASLKAHAGQFALPGGKAEEGESALEAVRREVEEEVGLHPGDLQTLGRLDDYVSVSGFHITPILLWSESIMSAVPEPGEVARILFFPTRVLTSPGVPTLVLEAGAERPILQVPLGGQRVIHAPTGAFLYQFIRWVSAREHVDLTHFAEPRFAHR